MKRLFCLFLNSAVLSLTVACVNEQMAEPDGGLVTKTFTAHTDVDTKTSLDTDFNILWDTEDHITVFDGDGGGKTFSDVTVSDDGRIAEFTGDVALANTYYAIYPKQPDAVYASEGEKITAVLPTIQTAVAGTFADDVNLAVAKTQGSDLYFRNVGALLAVKCPTAYANSIKIVSHDPSVKMSGEAVISFKDGVPVAAPSEPAVNHAEVTCSTTAVGDIYYFVVYPGEYKGFDIVFTSKNVPSSKAIFSTSKELSLKRNDNIMLFDTDGLWDGWNSTSAPYNVNAELAGPSGLAGVVLTWNVDDIDSNIADGFNIYAKVTGSSGNGSLVGTVAGNVLTYTVTGLQTSTNYDFGVQTKTVDGKKDSEIVWVTGIRLPAVDKCIAPSDLVLNQLNESSVKLSWTCHSSAETGFMVYKKDGSDVHTAVTIADATEYTFDGLAEGATYDFGVQTLGAYNNHSDVVYADAYTVLGWKELQAADAGDKECLKPENITYIQETSDAIGFRWECWSSVNTGFNLYVRPASEPEFNSSHFIAEIDRDTKTYCFSGLTTATEYVFGIQTKGATVLENSDIVEVTVTIKNFDWPYSYESARTAVPALADMTLCYGGDPERVPYAWTKERWRSHAVYTDADGNDHWFFDSFLALETATTHGGNRYIYSIANTSTYSAGRAQWEQQLDYWFDSTNGFQALDDCIDEAIATAGPYPHKRYVVFSLPDPIYCRQFEDKSSSTTYWGSINGVTLDFRYTEERIKAYKWMINQVRARFAAKNYKHIELAGFYILSENLSETYNGQYKEFTTVLPAVGQYCKDLHEGLYWIPYGYSISTATPGHDNAIKNWEQYKFTAAVLQPNIYWDDTRRDWEKTCKTFISDEGLGMELEFEGSHGEGGWSTPGDLTRTNASILETLRTNNAPDGTAKGQPNPQATRNKNRFRAYMTNCKEYYIYGNRMVVLYSGTNGLHELATSTDAADKTLYYELGEFIIDSPLKNN